MVSNESRPQGTSISEQYGRPVTLEDIEGLMDKEGVRRGTAVKVLNAIRAWSAWQQAKAVRPWDFTQGGLSQVDNARTQERRARIAQRMIDDAMKPKTTEPAITQPDAEVIELPVVPGQTIADAVAEYTRKKTETQPAGPVAPEPVSPAPEGAEQPGVDWEKIGPFVNLPPEPEEVLPPVPARTVPEALLPPEPEPVPAALEPEPAAVTPEPAPEPAASVPEPAVLTCKACRLELPAAAFGVDKSHKTGRMSICRPCRSARRADARHRKAREEAEENARLVREAQEAALLLQKQQAARYAARQAASALRAAAGSAGGTEPVLPGHKRCNGPCGLVKPYEEFRKNPSVSDGHRGRCKACDAGQYAAQAQETAVVQAPKPAAANGPRKECRRCGKMRNVPGDFYQRKGREISNTCLYCEREMARTVRERMQ